MTKYTTTYEKVMPLLLFLLLFLCGSGIAKAMQIRHARRMREICKIFLYVDNAL